MHIVQTLTRTSGIIDYIIVSITYLRFYYACKAQGLDRKTLPYTGWFQPYGAWFTLAFETMVVICFGYGSFRPTFSVSGFFASYILVLLDPCLYIGWKLLKRTKFVGKYEADLVWERPTIDAYEVSFSAAASPKLEKRHVADSVPGNFHHSTRRVLDRAFADVRNQAQGGRQRRQALERRQLDAALLGVR